MQVLVQYGDPCCPSRGLVTVSVGDVYMNPMTGITYTITAINQGANFGNLVDPYSQTNATARLQSLTTPTTATNYFLTFGGVTDTSITMFPSDFAGLMRISPDPQWPTQS